MIPCKEWIGKELEIVQPECSVQIISGHEAHSLIMLKGQKLRVVGVKSGNWLKCKMEQKVLLKSVLGAQAFDHDYFKLPLYTTSDRLLLGISLNFDKEKFKVVDGIWPSSHTEEL